MDIRVGSTPKIGAPSDSEKSPQGAVEARLLAIRSPRRRSKEPAGKEQRASETSRDPVNGRVLVLLIPDGNQLPHDIETTGYRVFLRFARR